ncbi:MAG TPA: DegT/DnrJ/EryC1/StrS family aminotransferase [Pirellulales bacterium]|nr:DegT/DnrJ/EryC1/StrS family aminotransferase [Pirellulales bacterium]
MEGYNNSMRIPVSRPYFWGDERNLLLEAFDGGWISSQGAFVSQFESGFASEVGVTHAIATCNGTCALQLLFAALGIQAGDEVIVPDFVMMAPIFALLHCGATPIPVDADETWNMDPGQIESRITNRTVGILAVHTYGHPSNMGAIAGIASRHNLLLVEDAAEAHGAKVDGRQVGTFGIASVFSFYANKIITCGEGGIVVTNDDALASRLRSLRNMCFGDSDETRFVHASVGFNFRMSNMHAAIGVAQLRHLDAAIADRRRIAQSYRSGLDGISGIVCPPQASWADAVNWVYGVLVNDDCAVSRQEMQQYLQRNGIETRRFFTPLHDQPFMTKDTHRHSYTVSSRLCSQGLYLPTYVGLVNDDIARITHTVRSIST